MAIRTMWGFSHLPQKGAIGALDTSFGLRYNGYGINAPNAYGTCWIDGNSISIINSTNAGVGWNVPVSAVTDMVSPKSIIGFRFKTTFLYYGAVLTIASVATNMTELGIPNAGEGYIEIVCDRVTKDLSYFVNGVFKLKKTATVVPMIAGQSILFATVGNGGIACSLSDFYFIDDTQDDTPCDRLGPVVVVPLNPITAVGQDWVSSDGKTLLEDLKVPYTDLASLAAPTVTSPTSMTPLEMTHDAITDKNTTILGVSMAVDSKRFPTSLTAVNMSLVNGSAVSSIGDLTYSSDLITYGASSVANKSPDGTPWTVTKLANTKVVLTPKSAV